jgi:malate synthase
MKAQKESIQITGSLTPSVDKILTPEAQSFLAQLHHQFNPERKKLLERRKERQAKIDAGENPTFPNNSIRTSDWQVASTPRDLQQRWVEITGPTDRKMLINALNSGADIFMADFEDANSPTWSNNIEGQQNLIEAIAGTLSFESPEGKQYKLNEQRAVLMVRPRGWHLEEKHFLVDNEPISASLFDFGLYLFHNAKTLLEKGSGPYFYLPKLENHLEARLWNEVFNFAQDELMIPRGTIRATVLLENILAAFEMEEILYELREHSAGLNAGRWDYIFSAIKKFKKRDFFFPDRTQITMTVPFMRAYTELLIQTCHKRGAHAMGGMAAFIPSRKDAQVNAVALEKVKEDKVRESKDGFDGTWVAHPDLVSIARETFKTALKEKQHQKERMRPEVNVTPKDLIEFQISEGTITEEGVRKNISIALQYLYAWLSGTGAVAIFNLMEDAATAEISRAQLWQWMHNKKALIDQKQPLIPDLYHKLADEETGKIKGWFDKAKFSQKRMDNARQLLDDLVLNQEFPEFLTLKAYQYLE